jgi:hypothetical protein
MPLAQTAHLVRVKERSARFVNGKESTSQGAIIRNTTIYTGHTDQGLRRI